MKPTRSDGILMKDKLQITFYLEQLFSINAYGGHF